MNLSLVKIRSFVHVARRGNFRKASEDLGLSSPALSTHVRDLEISLGKRLLHRTTRTVRLTSAGEMFFASAERALDELDTAVANLDADRRRVVIGCVSSLACGPLPAVLAEAPRLCPSIEVKLLDGSAKALQNWLVEGAADFGIGPSSLANKEIAFQHLMRDHFVAVFRPGHPLSSSEEVSLSDVASYPIIIKARGSDVYAIVDAAFAAEGMVFRPAHEVIRHSTLGGMIEAGLGVTLLPSMAVSMLGAGPLATARLARPTIEREIGLLRLRGVSSTAAANKLLRVLLPRFQAIAQH